VSEWWMERQAVHFLSGNRNTRQAGWWMERQAVHFLSGNRNTRQAGCGGWRGKRCTSCQAIATHDKQAVVDGEASGALLVRQ
jgi:hypothetical protein